jgi:hypothetical protein
LLFERPLLGDDTSWQQGQPQCCDYTPINRPRRPGLFSRDILDLFLRLESVPKRERDSDEWRADPGG